MEWLKTLGLNEKQSLLYQHLLTKGAATASELAKDLNEQRTNIYLLLDALMQHGLAEKDEELPVAQFKASNPNKLQELMISRQKALATSSIQMKQALPELLGLYHLNTAYDGMSYFEGIRGYEAALEDMSKSVKEVCVFGASELEGHRPDAWAVLMKMLKKRALNKIPTRILFEKELKESTTLSVDRSPLLQQYMKARFWGDSTFEGEIALYENTVVLTSYDEKLVSLVIKNGSIATTFQSIFNTAWEDSIQ